MNLTIINYFTDDVLFYGLVSCTANRTPIQGDRAPAANCQY